MRACLAASAPRRLHFVTAPRARTRHRAGGNVAQRDSQGDADRLRERGVVRRGCVPRSRVPVAPSSWRTRTLASVSACRRPQEYAIFRKACSRPHGPARAQVRWACRWIAVRESLHRASLTSTPMRTVRRARRRRRAASTWAMCLWPWRALRSGGCPFSRSWQRFAQPRGTALPDLHGGWHGLSTCPRRRRAIARRGMLFFVG